MIRNSSANPPKYIVATCTANTLAFIIPNTSPFVIGGLIVGLSLNEASAGFILTTELLAMGIAALCVAPFMAILSRRWLAIGATILIAASNAFAVSDLAANITNLTIVRVVAGVGAGMVLATANAAIAAASSPARLYGFALMVGWLTAAILGPVMAYAAEQATYAGIYCVWMVLALIALPLLSGIGERKASDSASIALPKDAIALGMVHLTGIVLVGMSMMAYFAFIERLGQRAGFSLSDIGLLFAAISFSGAMGAGLAATLGTRFGLIGPLIAGTSLHAIAIVIAVVTESKLLFAVGVISEGFTFMYLLTYQFAVAATFDNRGRWAAAASGAMIGSTGIGPYLGGAFITTFGYSSLTWLLLITTIPAIVAFIWVGHHLGSRA